MTDNHEIVGVGFDFVQCTCKKYCSKMNEYTQALINGKVMISEKTIPMEISQKKIYSSLKTIKK